MTQVHATAVVDPRAELADDVTIGPYAVIGPHVRMGAGSSIGAQCARRATGCRRPGARRWRLSGSGRTQHP